MTKKKVGVAPKYKEGIKTSRLHSLVPDKVRNECLEAIDKIVEPYKNKKDE